MTQAHPCFLSVAKTSSKYRHFPFLENQISIGRSNDMTYTILSNTISRCHAVIRKQGNNTWTITDKKSLNGIAVNGSRLKPLQPYTLQEGDTVQLGVSKDGTATAEFVYRFFSALKVRREPKASKDKKTASSSSAGRTLAELDLTAGVSKKRKAQAAEEDPQQHKRLKTAYKGELRVLTHRLKETEKEKRAIAQQLQEERQERHAVEKRQREQERQVSQLGAKQKQLMKEQAATEAQLRKHLEEQLRVREEEVRGQMQGKLRALMGEKRQVEDRLHREVEKAMREKDQQLQDQLQEEKERLQKVIETKELEQKALEKELAESKMEKEKAKADTLRAREAILSEFADTMETELQCSICSELLVKAISLNCSHAFCALCIRQWLSVKKECPNCRSAVTSQTHSIVLDNYIDRVVEQLSSEMKERRAALVAERKGEEARLDGAGDREEAGPSGAATRGPRPGRGRGRGGRGRGGRGRGGRAGARTAAAAVSAPEVATTISHQSGASLTADDEGGVGTSQSEVFLTDSEEDEDQHSSEYWDSSDSTSHQPQNSSESSEESTDEYGVQRGYYGGYGRCFSCGREGHWANQCPG